MLPLAPRSAALAQDHRPDVAPNLLDQIPAGAPIGTVTTDEAYDRRRCDSAIIERDAVPIIPIRKNGRAWKEDCPAERFRNEALRATRRYGRAFWKQSSEYRARQPDRGKPSRVLLANHCQTTDALPLGL